MSGSPIPKLDPREVKSWRQEGAVYVVALSCGHVLMLPDRPGPVLRCDYCFEEAVERLRSGKGRA